MVLLVLGGPTRVFMVRPGSPGHFLSKRNEPKTGHPKKRSTHRGLRTAAVFWEAWLLSALWLFLNRWFFWLILLRNSYGGRRMISLIFTCVSSWKKLIFQCLDGEKGVDVVCPARACWSEDKTNKGEKDTQKNAPRTGAYARLPFLGRRGFWSGRGTLDPKRGLYYAKDDIECLEFD